MIAKWIYLSYLIHESAPAYGGSQAFFDNPDKQMAKGDSCNTRIWRMSNHVSTHIDFPRHFAENGDTLDRYPAEFWVFRKAGVIILDHVAPGQILTPKDLEHHAVPQDVEMLMLRTGFCELRNDPVYWQNNPGLHPELASKLRLDFPELRVVGFDFISLASFANRQLGRQAHKSFLNHPRPLLLIEDMDLSEINQDIVPDQVIIAPIRVKNADAAPCMILAEVVK